MDLPRDLSRERDRSRCSDRKVDHKRDLVGIRASLREDIVGLNRAGGSHSVN